VVTASLLRRPGNGNADLGRPPARPARPVPRDPACRAASGLAPARKAPLTRSG